MSSSSLCPSTVIIEFMNTQRNFPQSEQSKTATTWLLIDLKLLLSLFHCVKCVQIWRYFWSVFSRIRTEYGEIKSTNFPECRKIRTRNNSVFGHYSSSILLTYLDAQRWTVFFSCLDFSVNIIKSQVMLTIWMHNWGSYGWWQWISFDCEAVFIITFSKLE